MILQNTHTLNDIQTRLEDKQIFVRTSDLDGRPTVIGYDKQFRWSWIATQLNTFIVVTEYGDERIEPATIEGHLNGAFEVARKEHTGWPRGFQSGIGVISVLRSTSVSDAAKTYCSKLQSGKKWAGFSIPVVIDSHLSQTVRFDKDSIWGKIYYPHFRSLIGDLLG